MRVHHSDIGTAAFPAALEQVMGNSSYAAAAKKIAVKLRARKRTPVQEAVGAYFTLYFRVQGFKGFVKTSG